MCMYMCSFYLFVETSWRIFGKLLLRSISSCPGEKGPGLLLSWKKMGVAEEPETGSNLPDLTQQVSDRALPPSPRACTLFDLEGGSKVCWRRWRSSHLGQEDLGPVGLRGHASCSSSQVMAGPWAFLKAVEP